MCKYYQYFLLTDSPQGMYQAAGQTSTAPSQPIYQNQPVMTSAQPTPTQPMIGGGPQFSGPQYPQHMIAPPNYNPSHYSAQRMQMTRPMNYPPYSSGMMPHQRELYDEERGRERERERGKEGTVASMMVVLNLQILVLY